MVNKVVKIIQSNIGELFASTIFGFAVYTATIGSYQTDQTAAPIIVALTIALSGVAIIYSFCDITVAHFNPVITFATICLKKTDFFQGIFLIISQILGFILAGLLSVAVLPGNYKEKLDIARPKKVDSSVSKGEMFATEFILTAILVYVVFAVGVNPYHSPKNENGEQLDPDEQLTEGRKIDVPLAIGLTLGFCALLGLGSSGGTFNPGIVLSPMILTGIWDNWWVYILGQLSGGLFGALVQSCLLYKIF